MHKVLTGLAAASALFAFVSAAQAECVGNHNVTASAAKKQETLAMSTSNGPLAPPVATEESKVAQVTLCADGEKDCGDETNSAPKH